MTTVDKVVSKESLLAEEESEVDDIFVYLFVYSKIIESKDIFFRS